MPTPVRRATSDWVDRVDDHGGHVAHSVGAGGGRRRGGTNQPPQPLAEPQAWEPHVDSGNTTMERVASTDAPLPCRRRPTAATRASQDQRQWEKPQDWRRFAHLRLRLRVTATDPLVTGKSLNFVFSDDRTRLENLPGTPPKQQGLAWVPAGEWLETSLDLSPLGRSAILGLQIYVYENPPAVPHTFRVEIARLELEGIDPRTTVFDGQAYGRRPLPARQGRPAARVATTDGLALLLGSAGEVRRVSFDGREVGRGARGPPASWCATPPAPSRR